MRLSFRGRLFSLFLSLFLVVGLLAGLVLERTLSDRIESAVADQLWSLTGVGRAMLAQLPSIDDPFIVDPVVDSLARESGFVVLVVSGQGRLIGDSRLIIPQIKDAPSFVDELEFKEAVTLGRGANQRSLWPFEERLILSARPFVDGTGQGIVIAASPRRQVEALQTDLRMRLLAIGLLSFVLSAIFAALGSHLITGRLRKVVSRLKAHGEDHEEELPDLNRTPDDLEGLTASLDLLLAQANDLVDSLAGERDRFGAVLQAMDAGVMVLDPQGSIELMNRRARKMLKLPKSALGGTIEEHANFPALEALADVSSTESLTEEIERMGPPLQTFLVSAAPVAAGGKVLVLRDLTPVRRVERMRRDFVANVSHELRTPVAIILAQSENLLDGALDDQEMAQKFLSSMHRQAERVTSLINDLLDLARIEAGQRELEREDVSIAAAARRAADGLASKAKKRDLRLEIDVPSGQTAFVNASALEQVLVNLLENAIKYTNEGTAIVLKAQPDGKKRLRLEVWDEGPGIPTELQNRVFERFYRVDKGRSRDLGGTGLGLAIVKHLVGQMGGRVGVDAREPNGAIFWFTVRRSQ